MSMTRTARIAFVTGANKGIGFEVTRQLAREGFRVFLGARKEEAGQAAAEKLNGEGRKLDHREVTFLQIDIANPESIQQAANEFRKQSERLDVLVNNAGIALRPITKFSRSRLTPSRPPCAPTPSALSSFPKPSFLSLGKATRRGL